MCISHILAKLFAIILTIWLVRDLSHILFPSLKRKGKNIKSI